MAIHQTQNNPAISEGIGKVPGQPSPLLLRFERGFYRFGLFMFVHWATLLMVMLGTLVTLALSVPFLSYFGLDAIAKPIFYNLHFVCAQIPSHSFYIFGHQLGMCERNFSIYASMFVGSLIFVLSKKRLKGIPWWIWLLLVLPLALDGTTQMFGLRESTWQLRVLTGVLFGFGNVWFVLPMMQKSLDETPMSPPRYQLGSQPGQSETGTPIHNNQETV